MKITMCIGSSCHVHGSRPVIEQIQKLVEDNGLQDKVELASTFCMGRCREGVCVTVDGEFHSVKPDSVNEFFEEYVLKAL